MTGLVERLHNTLERNTHRDIKEISAKMDRAMGNANSTLIMDWIEKHRYGQIEKMFYDADTQTEEERRAKEPMEHNQRLCSVCKGEKEKRTTNSLEIRKELPGGKDVEKFMEVAKKDWPLETYQNTNIETGHPAARHGKEDVVIVLDAEEAEKTLWGRKINMGGIRRLKEKIKVGKIVYQAQREGDYGEEEGTESGKEEEERYTFLLGQGKRAAAGEVEELYELCRKMTETADRLGRTRLCWAVDTPKGEEPELIRKILEDVTKGKKIQCTILTHRKGKIGGLGNEEEPELDKQEGKADNDEERGRGVKSSEWKKQGGLRKRGDRKKAATILVDIPEGKSFAEVARRINESTRKAKVENNIFRARKDDGGKIKIELARNAAEEEATIKAVKEAVGDPEKVRIREDVIPLIVRGVGEEATDRDVQEALGRGAIIRWTRRYREGDRAVMATVPAVLAKRLIMDGRVKILMNSCRVTRKEHRIIRCNRCYEYGHRIGECKGKDRRKNCRTCGAEGHDGRECEVRNCALCKEAGHEFTHFPGARECKAYKDACRREEEKKETNNPPEGVQNGSKNVR